ncbi:MAG: histidinol dehydrogenase [Bacteroidales bacterium]|nr:histidinol dehydrogenase [Bacteroidales bacterium]
MEIIINPEPSRWAQLTERNIPDDDPRVQEAVDDVIAQVKERGDAALIELAERFDHTTITALEVTDEEIAEAEKQVSPELKEAIKTAAANIEAFHRAQLMTEPVEVFTAPGVRCVQRQVAIERVGLYIPGGRAPLFSTVLMLAIPARIAGCGEVVLCTPQSHNTPIAPAILYSAKLCGVDHIYRVGGAQAIAAMALGTESIPRVDKIFGPGNRYVTKAKQTLSTATAIDMPAGPSEVLVMADESASPVFVASDMLSQAEHGPDSQALLVCHDADFARQVELEVERQASLLSRRESVEGSLSHSRILVFDHIGTMIHFVNQYGPEHLIIAMHQPWEVANQIKNAGSVFVGPYSPESAGDYASGTNHTLPTGGWARAFSGVNTDSFFRKITYQELEPEGIAGLAPTIIAMAEAEGLDAHAQAVKLRLQYLQS